MESSLITTSSFSSNPPQIKHHVFLSFRGKDHGNNFTSRLEKALRGRQIKTYIDDQLNRGDEISPSLLRAIKESKISVIVFSKGYASSRWCLEELVKILECRKNYGQIVIPFFYGVDPSVVGDQTGCYANSFAKHVQREQSLDKVQRWKDSLKEAADISGFNSLVINSKSVLIDKIVYEVLKKLNKMSPSYDKDLVGIRSGIEQIENWLMSGDVRSVGIWGIGGIGKTTLAQAVYRKICCQFDRSYFTGSVTEKAKEGRLSSLQKSLLSTLLEDENAHIGGTFTKNRLGLMKLLIIFDDVTGFHQIESLIGDLACLASGSRIIVTSRDKRVLQRLDRVYEVKELPFNYAHKLFCRHAFRQNCPDVGYKELSNRAVKKVGGIPLALRDLGCRLFNKEKKYWESALEKLKNIVSHDNMPRFKKGIPCWVKAALLGCGSFGSVYEGISDDGFSFAVKEVSLLDQSSRGKQAIDQLEHEMALLSQFEHENIVRYLGTDKDGSKLYIFLELATKGSLLNLYKGNPFTDSEVSAYTRQILHGLKYLHDQKVVHRDIKCANILVDADGCVKLADFGLAKAINLNDANSFKGTAFWMAPEVVKNQGYGIPADIWSLGCTVLEMLTSQFPYSTLQPVQALFKLLQDEPPPLISDNLSRDARDFILKCLQTIPSDRPTAAQLLDHSFAKRSLPTFSGVDLV